MSGWPPDDHEPVYVPPAVPADPLSLVEVKVRLAAERIRDGLSAGTSELEDVLPRAPDFHAHPGAIFTRAERAELDRTWDLSERARAVLEGAEDVLGGMEVGWRDGRRVVTVYLTGRHEHFRRLLGDAVGADRVIVCTAEFTETELEREQDLMAIGSLARPLGRAGSTRSARERALSV